MVIRSDSRSPETLDEASPAEKFHISSDFESESLALQVKSLQKVSGHCNQLWRQFVAVERKASLDPCRYSESLFHKFIGGCFVCEAIRCNEYVVEQSTSDVSVLQAPCEAVCEAIHCNKSDVCEAIHCNKSEVAEHVPNVGLPPCDLESDGSGCNAYDVAKHLPNVGLVV